MVDSQEIHVLNLIPGEERRRLCYNELNCHLGCPLPISDSLLSALATPLLIHLTASGRDQVIAQVVDHMGGLRSQDPGFGLAQPHKLWSLGNKSVE